LVYDKESARQLANTILWYERSFKRFGRWLMRRKTPMRTCTRKLEFDAAHRVIRHESKCKNLHGHRYVAEVTAAAKTLDDLGRVIDFGVIKGVVGEWIDAHWDHGVILNSEDEALIDFVEVEDWQLYVLECNPTAENMAEYLFKKANSLLKDVGSEVVVTHIRLHETPNCWADYEGE
jgi:6-pyruvoyltetrahydropterin/6-carboxytetrahydropterin synthase